MMKITKAQLEVIDKVLTRYKGDKTKAALNYSPNHLLNVEMFTRCMIEGYEVQKSKEDQIKELFNKYNKQGVAHGIIRKMCDIMEIKVEGVNDHEN